MSVSESEISPQPAPQVPKAPPTTPGPIYRRRRVPVWPTVLGIIYLIAGLGGAFASLINAIAQPAAARMSSFAPYGEGTSVAMHEYGVWIIVSNLIGAGVGLLLVACGILLLLKNRVAVKFVYSWAVLRILFGAVQAVITGLIQQQQFQVMSRQMASNRLPVPPVSFTFVGLFSVGMVLAWALVLPIASIVWFRTQSVREYIATWR